MLKQWMARAVLGRTSVGATVGLETSDQPDAAFEACWRGAMKTDVATVKLVHPPLRQRSWLAQCVTETM